MVTGPDASELCAKLRRAGALVLDLKVIPRARLAEVVGVMETGALKVKVRAAPERGKANEDVCEVLADYFDVPKGHVEIVAGWTTSQKRVKVSIS